MQQKHGLPAYEPNVSNNIEGGISATLQQSAFDGKLKKFELEIEKEEVDMLSLKMNTKEAINQLISDHIQSGPHKFQLQGKIELVKFVEENDQSHKTTIFVNTAMYHLYFGGVSDETIRQMVDQIVKTITIIGYHGSGYVIDEISRVNICLAKNIPPFRAGSYIPLPPNLKKHKRNVVNAQNTLDHNCFLFCYYAAYHAQPGKPPLYETEQRWLKNAQISTYDRKLQPNLVDINGDYQMPMSSFDIEQFELLNNVLIKVFR